jgi:hypothetical protein
VQIEGTQDREDAQGLNQGTISRRNEGVARIYARASVDVGGSIQFQIDPARLRFFDPETTEAIGFETVMSRISRAPKPKQSDAPSIAEPPKTTAIPGDGA